MILYSISVASIPPTYYPLLYSLYKDNNEFFTYINMFCNLLLPTKSVRWKKGAWKDELEAGHVSISISKWIHDPLVISYLKFLKEAAI